MWVLDCCDYWKFFDLAHFLHFIEFIAVVGDLLNSAGFQIRILDQKGVLEANLYSRIPDFSRLAFVLSMQNKLTRGSEY